MSEPIKLNTIYCITSNILADSNIFDVITEIVMLANKLNTYVSTTFNDIYLLVNSNSNIDDVLSNYNRMRK